MMTEGYRSALMVVCFTMVYGLSSISLFVSAAGGDVNKDKAIFQAKCVT